MVRHNAHHPRNDRHVTSSRLYCLKTRLLLKTRHVLVRLSWQPRRAVLSVRWCTSILLDREGVWRPRRLMGMTLIGIRYSRGRRGFRERTKIRMPLQRMPRVMIPVCWCCCVRLSMRGAFLVWLRPTEWEHNRAVGGSDPPE